MAIGVINPTLTRFAMGSHAWGRSMNVNAIRTSMLLQPAVLSRVASLPGSPAINDRYLNTTTNRLCMWIDSFYDGTATEPAQWVELMPTVGMLIFVEDEEKFYVWRQENEWQVAIDLNEVHQAVEREFAFYAPGKIRPSNPVFYYIAGMELTLESGAPGSHALLDVAPSGGLTFPIYHNNTQIGSVNFGSGATEGSVSISGERVIYDAWSESQQVRAHSLRVDAPADLKGAQGLSVTLRGKIRAMD